MNITNTAKVLIPLISLIPISFQFIAGIHIGGIHIFLNWLYAALHPSISEDVLTSSWIGLQVTICIATLSWCLSISLGTVLGLSSSYKFSFITGIPKVIPNIIRRILTIPRATHEIIWGLIFLQLFGLSPWIAIFAITIPYSSLISRVIYEQIDQLSSKEIEAIRQCGASKVQVITTSLVPKIVPTITPYLFYRLECAIRGATLLGIFGLGGIGTELQLSTLSLRFNEMWSSLWMLFISIFIVERGLKWLQKPRLYVNNIGRYTLITLLLISLLFIINIQWAKSLNIELATPITFHRIDIPKAEYFLKAIVSIPWLKLTFDTLKITVLASCIAISLPPLMLMLWPTQKGSNLLGFICIICRILPPPLTSILLLLCTKPSVSVAALALGIQNMGVLGRLLIEIIDKQSDENLNACKSITTNSRTSWIYGKLTSVSGSYLTYAIYRADIILRETVIVGVVGGIGLGWQLNESLSSFAWEEVILVTATFIFITLIGETLSEKIRNQFFSNNKVKPQTCP